MISTPVFEREDYFSFRPDKRCHGQYRYRPVAVPPTRGPQKDIYLYVNSPGGSVTATLAMYDTIKHIKPDVSTICVGMAASGAAVILAAGAKQKIRLAQCRSDDSSAYGRSGRPSHGN